MWTCLSTSVTLVDASRIIILKLQYAWSFLSQSLSNFCSAAFVDISPEETKQDSAYESIEDVTETTAMKDAQSATDVSYLGGSWETERECLGGCVLGKLFF